MKKMLGVVAVAAGNGLVQGAYSQTAELPSTKRIGVPDVDIESRELLRPLGRDGIHALKRDAIDVVVIAGPGIAAIGRIERFAGPLSADE